MIRLSEYVSKNKFASIRKDIPYILNMTLDRGYYLEVFRQFEDDARESVYLFTDIEITLGEVFSTFAKDWGIPEREVHINTVTLDSIKESADSWNQVWEDKISLEEFIVYLTEILPPERLEVLKKDSTYTMALYKQLEYDVSVPSTIPDKYFVELVQFLEKYKQFEEYLKNRPSN